MFSFHVLPSMCKFLVFCALGHVTSDCLSFWISCHPMNINGIEFVDAVFRCFTISCIGLDYLFNQRWKLYNVNLGPCHSVGALKPLRLPFPKPLSFLPLSLSLSSPLHLCIREIFTPSYPSFFFHPPLFIVPTNNGFKSLV